jgi:anti-sigma regulatory factor (Ser/Thr protein kinase)
MIDTLRLEHSIRAPGHARRWIAQRCREWDCEALAESAALLISELVTNVFLHARTDCLVRAAFDAPTLTVSITDEGDGDLTPLPRSDTAEQGRGLAIVAELADAWGIEHGDGAKSVWFHLSD